MPRKNAGTLEEQRNKIKKSYKHGSRSRRELVDFESLDDVTKAAKLEAAAFFKASDFSYSYIAEALGTTRGTVKGWFETNPQLVKRVAEIRQDFLKGALALLKTYAIELVEMLVEIARSDIDPNVRLKAITEALDRLGLSKVNKSESVAANTLTTQVDIVDQSGLLEALKDADPEIQTKVAEKMEQMLAIAAEHTDMDVTK